MDCTLGIFLELFELVKSLSLQALVDLNPRYGLRSNDQVLVVLGKNLTDLQI